MKTYEIILIAIFIIFAIFGFIYLGIRDYNYAKSFAYLCEDTHNKELYGFNFISDAQKFKQNYPWTICINTKTKEEI